MTAREFWEWFVVNEARLWTLDDQRQDVLDSVEDALASYHVGLSFEISDEENGVRELILSANGDRDLFQAVEELWTRAPALRRWRIIALRPPRGFEFALEAGDTQIRPSDLVFEPLTIDADSSSLGIRVFVPAGLGDSSYEMVERLITIGLGEKAAATELQRIEVAPKPSDVSELLPLSQLPEYIDWFRSKVGKRQLH